MHSVIEKAVWIELSRLWNEAIMDNGMAECGLLALLGRSELISR